MNPDHASTRPEHRAAYRAARRVRVIEHYGGVCSCCGESQIEFLAIDHAAGGGNEHRAEIRRRGSRLIDWIIVNDFPPLFRVLCHNCNTALGAYGYCPHTRP